VSIEEVKPAVSAAMADAIKRKHTESYYEISIGICGVVNVNVRSRLCVEPRFVGS